jgi:hypothetical protein
MDRRTRTRVGIAVAFLAAFVALYAGSGAVRGWLVHTIHGR